MSGNQLAPQATVAFKTHLDLILGGIEKDILSIKQHFNSRNLLYSSGTVQKIYELIDDAIAEMGKAASKSARLAYKAGNHEFSTSLESELLDAFEGNFSYGYQQICATRISATQPIRDSLSNKQMLQNDGHLQIAERALTVGRLELRQYFQTLRRARKQWYEHIPRITKLVLWLFKPH